MSVEPRGDGWRVRWRVNDKSHSKQFGKGEKTLAKNFDAEVKRARRLGTLSQLMVQMEPKTLGELGEEWWELHGQNKAESTQRFYAWTWNSLIAPHLGSQQVSSLTPGDIEACFLNMDRGPAVRRKAMTLLHQILKYGIKKGYLISNPVTVADKPKLPRREPILVPSPTQIEETRKNLLGEGRLGDATLVSVLAYAGLRPGEALILPDMEGANGWLLVRDPKRSRNRRAKLLEPVQQDIKVWLEERGPGYPILFPTATGGTWKRHDYNNWRRRIFQPAAPEGITPYSLRHAFVSLMLRDPGYSRTEVADWAGHSLKVQDSIYRHVVADGEGNAEEAIWQARAEVFDE